MAPAAQVDIFGNVSHHINHFLLFVELQSLLREIAEAHGLADVEPAAVGLLYAKQQFYEGALAGSVVADDAHLFVAGEVVVEVFKNGYRVLFSIAKSLRDILTLENFAADVNVAAAQSHLPFLDALLSHALKVGKGLFAIACLVASCLRLSSHPFQFSAVQVVGSCYFRPSVVYALLPFLKIVTVVAAICIYRLVVEFHDDIAHAVEEETVVGYHEQSLVSAAEKSLEPFYHLKVEVVCGLVKYQEVWLCDENIGESDAFLLSSTQFAHRLFEVPYLQFCEDLLCFQHFLLSLGPVVIVLYRCAEACVKNALVGVEVRRLFEIAHAETFSEDDVAAVVALVAVDNR